MALAHSSSLMRRRVDDVGGRLVEVHLVDPQIGVDDLAELVHRRAAGDEVLHHLRRHRRRIGRDAARGDAVIAGEDAGARMIEPRRVAALPGGEPMRQFLQAPERAGRLGELALAQHRRGAGLEIGAGQMRHQRADLVQARRHFRHSTSPLPHPCPTSTKKTRYGRGDESGSPASSRNSSPRPRC